MLTMIMSPAFTATGFVSPMKWSFGGGAPDRLGLRALLHRGANRTGRHRARAVEIDAVAERHDRIARRDEIAAAVQLVIRDDEIAVGSRPIITPTSARHSRSSCAGGKVSNGTCVKIPAGLDAAARARSGSWSASAANGPESARIG
jgi:hypothetical protein